MLPATCQALRPHPPRQLTAASRVGIVWPTSSAKEEACAQCPGVAEWAVSGAVSSQRALEFGRSGSVAATLAPELTSHQLDVSLPQCWPRLPL